MSRAVRKGARVLLNACALLPALGPSLWARLGLLLGSEQPYSSAAFAVSIVPGLPGVLIRRAFYCTTLASCHWDFTVHFGSVVTHPTARIGRNVWIGAYSLVGRCRIEDDVIIGSRVSVLSGRRPHRFEDPNTPIQDQHGEFAEIRLGRDSWLGEGSIVMADLGRGSVVGAGAVVVKPGEDFAVLVGNPARQAGTRGQTDPS